MTLEQNSRAERPESASEQSRQHEHDWHALGTEEVLDHLRVQGNGLTSEEAKRRLDTFGPNQLQEAPRPTFLRMLWEQLNNFVVILLIIASVISALLGDYVEAAAIMAIVVLNAVLGSFRNAGRRRPWPPSRNWRRPMPRYSVTGAGYRSLRMSLSQAIWFFSKRATLSPPTYGCWKRSTCGWRRLR